VHSPACPPGGRGTGPKVADIFRSHGAAFAAAHPLSARKRKVLDALVNCRTAALGGHVDTCTHCGFERPSYNSCRDRHCPSCQTRDQERWIAARHERILNTHYFHVVFTLPEPLRVVALQHPTIVYDALFAAAADTLLAVARRRLKATIGITAVLHTWTRELLLHPHVHCIVTGGGLSLDQTRWCPTQRKFLFAVRVLRKLFRAKLLACLQRAHDQGRLIVDDWSDIRRRLRRKTWVVFSKPTFDGPEKVIAYLGRYTHRVAISSSRLVSVSDDAVTFRTRGDDTVTITPEEFIRRFLLHVLPSGFRKIRHYGLLSPTGIHSLFPIAKKILGEVAPKPEPEPFPFAPSDEVCPACRIGSFRRRLLSPPLDRPRLPKWKDTS
jgi:hypothetical protein